MRAQQCRSWTNENAGYLCLVQTGGREQDVDGETAQLGEADEDVDRSLQD